MQDDASFPQQEPQAAQTHQPAPGAERKRWGSRATTDNLPATERLARLREDFAAILKEGGQYYPTSSNMALRIADDLHVAHGAQGWPVTTFEHIAGMLAGMEKTDRIARGQEDMRHRMPLLSNAAVTNKIVAELEANMQALKVPSRALAAYTVIHGAKAHTLAEAFPAFTAEPRIFARALEADPLHPEKALAARKDLLGEPEFAAYAATHPREALHALADEHPRNSLRMQLHAGLAAAPLTAPADASAPRPGLCALALAATPAHRPPAPQEAWEDRLRHEAGPQGQTAHKGI